MPPYIKNTLLNFLSFFLIAFSLYIFISLVSYDISDSGFFNKNSNETVNNLGGPLGAKISDFLNTIFGFGGYLVLLIGSVWAIQTLFFEDPYSSLNKSLVRLLSSILLLICFCSIGYFYFLDSFGGVIGKEIIYTLSSSIGDIGSLIFLVILLIPSTSLAFNFSWLKIIDKTGEIMINFGKFSFQIISRLFVNLKELVILFFSKVRKIVTTMQIRNDNKVKSASKPKISKEPQIKEKHVEEIKKDLTQGDLPIKDETPLKEVSKESYNSDEEKKEKAVMPSTELLDRALDDGSSLSESELNQIAELLEAKLEEFGIEATVESVLPGPVVTRFEIQPAPGTKASKITNIAQDIARSLSVSSVRVVEVIEGKSYVGIEIPNNNRKMVRLTEILSSKAFKSSPSNLSVALGQDISGNPIVVDLSKMPHLLVAGTTGSGKSVGLNAMLLSLLFKSDPEEVRLILVELMSMMGVRNLAGFNKKILDAEKNGKQILNPLNENEDEYLEVLPSIVVVVDEFADMMMLVGKKVEHLIARIAQKARAAGIHLILATQRPSVDVITGLIKANIPTRIAFQVSTKIDSRTILDQGGAEQLLGYGDMLYLPPGVGVPVRVHGAFVGDDEVHRVVNDWKSRAKPNYVDEITSSTQDTGPIPGWTGADAGNSDEQDELYDEAVNFVIESRRASISAVQRKLRIGYNRAARLIETMEEAGLVSEMSSNGSREVLVPKRD